MYQSHRSKLTPMATVSVARVLAAKKDLLTVHRTSSGEAREATQCAINKVMIGKVSTLCTAGTLSMTDVSGP